MVADDEEGRRRGRSLLRRQATRSDGAAGAASSGGGALRNAAVAAALLNRTFVVPQFRVTDPASLRASVWDHAMQLLRERRYVSMGDIVDISPIKSMVRTIDFRVFVSLWCGVVMRKTCFSGLCCAVSGGTVAALCQMPTIDADLYCLVLEAVKKVVYILYKMIVEQQYDSNWTKIYLANVAIDERFKLYTLKESDELVLQTAERLMAAEHGVRSGFLPKTVESMKKDCDPIQLPEILLFPVLSYFS
ncbi:hypothetical protein U9M48_013541 [Paspalum notatum var. saurae]|uniref:Uncharacterized protein n=1 Tax=Paspalum notatum var. saurae TaxID=547442 RepID=A0AAQ3T0T5_PASNO